jgi:DNA-directed RNA polymerase subunit delta
MSIKKKSIEELELMSYNDIAYEIIKEDKKKKYNTPTLFKEVCKLLGLSDEEFAEKLADFFTALTTDGRFILIDSTNWDLKENHAVKVVVDDGDEEEIESDEEDETDEESDNSDDIEDDYSDEAVDSSSEDEEDMQDLTIVDEEDIEE